MEDPDRREILEDVSFLIEAKQAHKLRAIMLDAHPADIAELLVHLEGEPRRYLFGAPDWRPAADVIAV